MSSYWADFEKNATEEELDQVLDEKASSPRSRQQKRTHVLNKTQKFQSLKGIKKESPDAIEKEMAAIAHEMLQDYKVNISKECDVDDGKTIDNYLITLLEIKASPRLIYLTQRYRYLQTRKKSYDDLVKDQSPPPQPKKMGKANILKAAFDVMVKFADILDDAWSALRGMLPESVIILLGPFLFGAVGFLVHLGQGIEAIGDIHRAYTKEKISARKSRLLAGVITCVLAGTGVGMGISLLASAAGLQVLGMTVMPMLLPALLTGIYGVGLCKRIYLYQLAEEKLEKAKANYELFLAQNKKNMERLQARYLKIKKLQEEYDHQIQLLLKKPESTWNNEDQEKYRYYTQERKLLFFDELAYQKESANIHGELDAYKKQYQLAKEKALKQERELAFNTVDILCSTLVLAGTILSFSAIIGLGAISFGVAPLALLLSGVVIGGVVKAFQKIDEKKGYAYSKGIRSFFVNQWNKLTKKEVHLPTEKAHYTVPSEMNLNANQGGGSTSDMLQSMPLSANSNQDENQKKAASPLAFKSKRKMDLFSESPKKTPENTNLYVPSSPSY